MNRRQLLAVLVALPVFAAGVLLALRPLEDSGGDVEVLSLRVEPLRVLLALGVSALGMVIALGGCYLAGRRR